MAVAGDGRIVTGSTDRTTRISDARTGETLTISAAVGVSWATWTAGPHGDPLATGGDAWRWLRLRVFDEQGRFVSQDPYEWYFPTHGRAGVRPVTAPQARRPDRSAPHTAQ